MQIDFARVEVYPKLLVNVGQNDSSLRTQIGPMQSAKTNPSHKQNINKYMYIYIIIYIYMILYMFIYNNIMCPNVPSLVS